MSKKFFALLDYEGHAFDGIILKDKKLLDLIKTLAKIKVNVVGLNITNNGIQVLVDKPITEDNVKFVTITEKIVDRKGKVKHHKR